MTDNYDIKERVQEIYDAYEKKGRTRDFVITLTPINGSGDIAVSLKRTVRNKYLQTKELTIKKEDSLEFIGDEFYDKYVHKY